MTHTTFDPHAGALLPHPSAPTPPGRVEAAWAWRSGDLWLQYRVSGAMALRWPERQAPGPADGLWRHTCFEAFVGTADAPLYHEYNFSPSTCWARYRFHDERARDEHAERAAGAVSLAIHAAARAGEWQLSACVPASDLPLSAAGWTLGLSAVLEDKHGRLSHWALAHPGPRPDFHHPGGRVWRLPPA